MKTVAVLVFVALLAGCSMQGSNQSQLAALQKQVTTLSAKVGKVEATKTALTNFDLQERCAAAAKRTYTELKSDDAGPGGPYSGFVSNYNRAMGHCFIAYVIVGDGSTEGWSDVTIMDAIRGVTYSNCTFTDTDHIVEAVGCWVRWNGKTVTCTSVNQFREYRGRFMGAAMESARG